MNNDKARSALTNIAELCIDGISGYKDAAEKVDDTNLKALFSTFAKEREAILNAISQEIVQLGGKVVTQGRTDGTALGSIHQFWLDLKAKLSGDTAESILEECERGEKYILDKFDEVLKNRAEYPVSTVNVLQDARYTIWKRLETIKHAEDARS